MADKRDKDGKAPPPVNKKPDSPQMGVALRTVYQRTVEEPVPDEMLDLLSKLG